MMCMLGALQAAYSSGDGSLIPEAAVDTAEIPRIADEIVAAWKSAAAGIAGNGIRFG